MEDKLEYFTCQCTSAEHTLRFDYLTLQPGQEPELYTEILLNQTRGFFGRVVYAIRYIFGYQSKYGAFDCFLMRVEEAGRLKTLLTRYEIEMASFNSVTDKKRCAATPCESCECE